MKQLQEVVNYTRWEQAAKQKLRDDPGESWRHPYLDGAIDALENLRIHTQGLIAFEAHALKEKRESANNHLHEFMKVQEVA